MPITEELNIKKEEVKSYPPIPEDIYQVELLDVKTKQAETYDSRKRNSAVKEFETNLVFQYTILEEELHLRNLWDNFVPAVLYIGKNGKNKLYKIVEALLGRELTPEEEAVGIDNEFLNSLIGKQMRVGVKNKKTADGKVFSNADTYYPKKVDLTPLTEEQKEEVRVKKGEDATKETDDFEKSGDEGIDEDSIPF